MNVKYPFCLLIISVLLSACENSVLDKSPNQNNLNLSGASVGFTDVQSAILAPRCLSCHSGYSSYAAVRNELTAISSAIESNRMPKTGGPLSDQQKQLLRVWIANGAPETPGAPPPEPEDPILLPIWSSISEKIITPRCLVCHNPNGQAKFLDLSSRQIIFSARNRLYGDNQKLIDIENPEQSYLISVIQDPIEPMPPVWSNIRRLDDTEIRVLIEWIARGLP